ncbi:MAG: hypothetical protein Q8L60_14105 [Gammaproteobacteria bacterium]|nr:hypothetical protein [Gammaproteobacteria bacterium]MDP2142145.1 hypothetical protein [Gammaproteobacteria bacterium]MDP2348247.1 hypothetical protein [Gammaproteobacteria bacterium]
MDKRIKSLFFIMSFATAPAWAQWAEIVDVEVSPAVLTDRSQIEITISGQKGDPCHIIEHSYTIDDNQIAIDVTVTGNPVAICPAVVVPYEFTTIVGSLSAGDYTLTVTINDTLDRGEAEFTVAPHTQSLTLSPVTGTYASMQQFDFGMVLEHEAEVVSGEAYIFGQNTGREDWVDISAPLAQCLRSGVLEPQGKTYRCPSLSEHLGEGTHTILVKLRLSDATEVTGAVTWTILGGIE